MTDLELLDKLTPRDVIALTVWGEARGESKVGRVAVANVIANRVKARRRHWGLDPKAVCLKAWQFSCWTPEGGRGNNGTVMDAARSLVDPEKHRGPIMRECVEIADALLARDLPDVTGNSTHYLTDFLYRSEHCPEWAKGRMPAAHIGSHLFFAGVD